MSSSEVLSQNDVFVSFPRLIMQSAFTSRKDRHPGRRTARSDFLVNVNEHLSALLV